MRFFHNLTLAALVAVVVAQGGPNNGGDANPFLIPSGGWQVTAGTPITLNWTPTDGSTVTLKLQYGGITTESQGITIASGIPNSGSYTWTPSASLVAEPDFTIKIIDDQDTDKFDFSPRFTIGGATGTATPAASTGSSSAAVSSTSGSSSPSASASKTSSSASASTSASSSSASASTTSGSSTPSSTPSATPSTTPASTTAPNNSGTANTPSALMGLLLGLVALL